MEAVALFLFNFEDDGPWSTDVDDLNGEVVEAALQVYFECGDIGEGSSLSNSDSIEIDDVVIVRGDDQLCRYVGAVGIEERLKCSSGVSGGSVDPDPLRAYSQKVAPQSVVVGCAVDSVSVWRV